jgi:hypothetical protein
MSAALAIASLSFSVRLPRLLPAALRHPIVYALPTLTVLATMCYWLWRVRSKRAVRPAGVASGFSRTSAVHLKADATPGRARLSAREARTWLPADQ